MVTGQVEPERLGALHELTEVGISAQKVLHQLSAKGLLAPNQLSNSLGVPLGEGGDRVVDDLEHRLGCRSHRLAVALPHNGRWLTPHSPGCGQVQVDTAAGRHSCGRGAPALTPYRLQLRASRLPTERGRLSEHGQVVAE